MTVPEDTPSNDRDEAPGERLDRQFNELLQELRVTQTGIQLLGGFLLILPFQARFAELGQALRATYLVAISAATLSTFFVIAPVVTHRLLFQSHRKDLIVKTGHASAKIGLALLGLTVITATALIFGFVLSPTVALIAGIVAAVICLGLWVAYPLVLAAARPAQSSYSSEPN